MSIVSKNKKNPVRICLVTEEIAGIAGSGGIGAAFLELAKLLASEGASVDVIYCPIASPLAEKDCYVMDFLKMGIRLRFLVAEDYVEFPITYEKKSYALARYLSQQSIQYDFIHFHDYKGLGFFSTSMKNQGLAFPETKLVVQLHGPTRWTLEANRAFFIHEDQLKIDFMERRSIAQADAVVSPSQYLVDWLGKAGFDFPTDVRVIKNVCSDLYASLKSFRRSSDTDTMSPASDIVLFARHEDRKGFAVFCDALDIVSDVLKERRVTVTFLGKFGYVNCQPSGVYLMDRAKKWSFPIKLRSGFARDDAARYIGSLKNPVVVIPSPSENSPYTVFESIVLGAPTISSTDGGGPELFNSVSYDGLCDITPEKLAEKILVAVEVGISRPTASESNKDIEIQWVGFHNEQIQVRSDVFKTNNLPKVTFAITHFERPSKLVDAIFSAVKQSYKNIEIIVVDDGSKSAETVSALAHIEDILERVGGRLIRQENGYLGAARNTALKAATGEYICFLDDDDIAKPELLSTLVKAALSSGADIVNCFNLFMDISIRGDVLASTNKTPQKVAYVPLGGPLSLAPMENCLGAATALFKRESLVDIGGYSEIKGVGHEDYELFLRMLQAGKKLVVAPVPLYFYEVGRPSMLSKTSLAANFRRCFDAVDTSKNFAEWRDFVSLQTGKTVAVNAHNRQYWLYSQAPTGVLRNRLLSENPGRVATLELLMELAEAEKLSGMKAVFMDDVRSTYPVAEEDTEEPMYELIPAAATLSKEKRFDGRLLDARLSLALGRVNESIKETVSVFGSAPTLSKDDVQFLEELIASAHSVDPDIFIPLSACLKEARTPQECAQSLLKSAVAVEFLANNVESVLNLVSANLKDWDSQYRSTHVDVASGVASGQFKSGAQHFFSYGIKEGRKGFDVVTNLESISGAGNVLEKRYGVVLEKLKPVTAKFSSEV